MSPTELNAAPSAEAPAAAVSSSAEEGCVPASSAAMLRQKAPWFAIALAALLADLVTKWWVFYPHALEPDFEESQVVGRVFTGWDTVLVYNQGITFGMLEGTGAWILAAGTAVVIGALAWKLWRLPMHPVGGAAGFVRMRRLEAFALAIVIGGAVGNLYDRTLRPLIEPDTRPGVRDFLDWYVPADTAVGRWLIDTFGRNHWYVSNVADVCIVCGVILLAWCILREPQAEAAPALGAAASLKGASSRSASHEAGGR
jgi:signal peptidase II